MEEKIGKIKMDAIFQGTTGDAGRTKPTRAATVRVKMARRKEE